MAQKRKSDGGGVGPHVRALRGARADFEPDVKRIVIQFLIMLNKRYTRAFEQASNRYEGLAPAVRDGIRRRLSQLADAAQVLAQDACGAWPRVEWAAADALVDEWAESIGVLGVVAGPQHLPGRGPNDRGGA